MLPLIVSLIMAGQPLPFHEYVINEDPIEDFRVVWLDALNECENKNGVEKILDTNNKYSYGAYMFQMGTWLSFGKKFGATEKNIGDNALQRVVAKSMLDKGLWKHWYNCGKKLNASLGEYPVD